MRRSSTRCSTQLTRPASARADRASARSYRLAVVQADAVSPLPYQPLGQGQGPVFVSIVEVVEQRGEVDPGDHDHIAVTARRGHAANVARAAPEVGEHQAPLAPVLDAAGDGVLEVLA